MGRGVLKGVLKAFACLLLGFAAGYALREKEEAQIADSLADDTPPVKREEYFTTKRKEEGA